MEDNNYDVESEELESSTKMGKLKRQRNLKQFKNLTDNQFEERMEKKVLNVQTSEAFEKRISKKWAEFENDYDLSDLKINDRDSLRALIQMQLTYEDYEQHMYQLRSEGISEASVFSNEKIGKFMSDLRSDISKVQNDLNITRKVRKSDKDISTLASIEDLKQKAKIFYESKMSYIFCDKCNMLLATVWTLYPEEERNKMVFICNRVLPDGSKCGHRTVIDTKTLLENRGTNKIEITPESMR